MPDAYDAGPHPESPLDEGLGEPELPIIDIEGARLLANDARERLAAEGFDDDEIDDWARAYFEDDADGAHEGDVDGLVAYIIRRQSEGHGPA